MKRYDPRLWIGGLLIFFGVLTLLENLNIIHGISNIFWGVIFGGIGLYFLYNLLNNNANWWMAFPAFTLLGLAAASLLPSSLDAFSGLAFMGGISIAFWWVYFTDRNRWWAIIPGGVLLTLGVVSVLDEIASIASGGLFFLGLGLTFILVAILPGGSSRSWALIPGTILIVFGAILGTPFANFTQYLLPIILIALGGYFTFRYFSQRSTS